MYLLYLDESGNASNPNDHFVVLGGVLVFERQTHWLAEKLDALAAKIDPEGFSSLEFHASTIFSAKEEPWNKFKDDVSARQRVISDVLRVLAHADETTHAFACAVEKASYPGSNFIEFAFEELCSRFDIHLIRKFKEANDPQRGLIILDKCAHERSLQKFARLLKIGGSKKGSVIHNLAEVPVFVDSRASRLLQLADHVAHSVFRAYECSDMKYLNLIINRFGYEDGKLHYLIHKTRRTDCMCPACMSRRIS